jgi:uncharacterized membrane protein YgcG
VTTTPPAPARAPARLARRRPSPRAAAAALAVIAALALIAALGARRAAHAQSGEAILSYAVAIAVQSDGGIVVDETIRYDFAGDLRHGIFRDIPVRLRYDDQQDRLYPLEVLGVSGSPGTPVQYSVEHPGGGIARIRIGDPNQTITGVRNYEIRYRIAGALNGFSDHDELYWNAIGADWSVPITKATVDVTAPGAITNAACYAGWTESRLSCAGLAVSGQSAHFTQPALGPNQALSVVIAFPTGLVPAPQPILQYRWSLRRAFTIDPLRVGLALALAAAIAAAIWRLVWIAGRDLRYVGSPIDVAFGTPDAEVERVGLFDGGPTPVEYEPPDGIRPGQVGTLVDERANPLDVTATIIDLAARGYLRIHEIPKEHWWGAVDWRLTRLKTENGLLEYERLLLDGLFEDGGEVLLSSLKRQFAARLGKVQQSLYDDAVSRGWFPRSPQTTRLIWLVAGVGALGATALIEGAALAWTTFALVPVPAVIGSTALIALHGAMPRRTAKGTAVLRRVQGFRRFIEEAEKEPARFAERALLFSEYLPYAVVFGCVDRWAKAFAGLAEPPHTNWYVGTHPFTTLAFAEAISSFSVTSAGTIASTAASSGGSGSGFGGGGFAGGGGGGGGGGSW